MHIVHKSFGFYLIQKQFYSSTLWAHETLTLYPRYLNYFCMLNFVFKNVMWTLAIFIVCFAGLDLSAGFG